MLMINFLVITISAYELLHDDVEQYYPTTGM